MTIGAEVRAPVFEIRGATKYFGGVTTVSDAVLCAEAGADAIGLNFWSGSKRAIDVGRAADIARALPPGVVKVGVFVDARRDAIIRAR